MTVMLIESWINGYDHFMPERVIATATMACDHACGHCYWPHANEDFDGILKDDSDLPGLKDWAKPARTIANRWPNADVVYAGRMLIGRGREFIRTYHDLTGNRVGIVDSGSTICHYPELLDTFSYMDISIDGGPEAHNRRRPRKDGKDSFPIAWKAVKKLQKRGYTPRVSAALNADTLNGWDQFEDRLIDSRVPLTTALVWDLPATQERDSARVRTKKEANDIFYTLINGCEKVLTISALQHLQWLSEPLSKLEWEPVGDVMQATIDEMVVVRYRPASLIGISEIDLSHTGNFLTSVGFTQRLPRTSVDAVDGSYLAQANAFRKRELEVWSQIQ